MVDRPLNCMMHDLGYFLEHGLKVDGVGLTSTAAGPAKHMGAFLNHAGQILQAGQNHLSGGQGLYFFNTYAAPFAVGLSDEELKQSMQNFIFNLNMSYVSRGSQPVFSTVGIDIGVPDTHPEYKVYEEENLRVAKQLLLVLMEGDFYGKPHLFPNLVVNLRGWITKDNADYREVLLLAHHLSAKFGSTYYNSQSTSFGGTYSTVMGALGSDEYVLTHRGPVKVKELCLADKLITWADGEFVLDTIKAIIPKDPCEFLYEVTLDNGKSIRISPEHKLPVIINGEIQKMVIEDIEVGDELFEFRHDRYGGEIDDWEYLKGIFLADGYVRRNIHGKYTSNQVEFHLKREDKSNKICEVLDRIGFIYKVVNTKAGTKKIIVENERLATAYAQLYDEDGDKCFPWTYDKKVLYSRVQGLRFDSNEISEDRWTFSSSNPKIYEPYLYALDLLGLPYSIRFDNRTGKNGNWKPNAMIRILVEHKPSIIKSIEQIPNDDLVYDISMFTNFNYVAGLGGICSYNCRTRLNTNWTGEWEQDVIRTGNACMVSLNLPRIMYDARLRGVPWEEALFDAMDYAHDALDLRYEMGVRHLERLGPHSFLTQGLDEGDPYYRVENATLSFGFVGLDEAIRTYLGGSEGITQHPRLAHMILKHMNNYVKEECDESHRWSVIATPAESTAGRFALADSELPTPKKGKGNGVFYSNSFHVPVDQPIDIVERIKTESQFHEYAKGGAILNLFLGEAYPGPEGLMSLTGKIMKTDTGFWCYSKVLSLCYDCKTFMGGKIEVCPSCGEVENVEYYDRITGYYQAVGHAKMNKNGWNVAKQNEFRLRRRNLK